MLTVDARSLHQALDQVRRIVTRRTVTRRATTLPLRSVRCECGGGALTLTTTGYNTDAWITAQIDCQGDIDPCCVPLQVLRSLPRSGEVAMFRVHDGKIGISHGSMVILVQPAEAEFPEPPVINPLPDVITLSRKDVTDLASLTGFTCRDASRQALTGIYVRGNTAAATDTHRLAMAELTCRDLPEVIIPRRVIEVLDALVPRTGQDVEFTKDGTHVAFKWAGTAITTKTIEGPYAKYGEKKMMGLDVVGTVRYPRNELMTALRQFATAGVGRSSGHTMITPQDGAMRLNSQSPDCNITHHVRAEIEGDVLPMAWNHHYLLDAAAFLGSSEWCEMQITGDWSQAYMRNNNRTMVLMPQSPPYQVPTSKDATTCADHAPESRVPAAAGAHGGCHGLD